MFIHSRIRHAFLLIIVFEALPHFAHSAVINGDFSTGDFTGWTIFTDPNGTANGDPNSGGNPEVVLFDVSGGGSTLAAQFRVGQTEGTPINQGAGLFQSIETVPGELILSVDIALESFDNNAQGGLFELSLNGSVVDSIDIQTVTVGQIVRDSLTATVSVGAGSQELRMSARRRFGAGSDSTPAQYFDNVIASGSAIAIPEPSSAIALAVLAAWFTASRRRLVGRRG